MPVLTGTKLTLPNATVPLGTATVRLPDGKEVEVEIKPSLPWLEAMRKIVAVINGNL